MLRGWINPWATFNDLRHEVDRLFDNLPAGSNGGSLWRAHTYPAMNVWEDGDFLHAEAEIPGVKGEDLEVYAVGNELTIKGRRAPMEGRNLSYHRQERGSGEFTRVVTLPADVDAGKVEATLKEGVLTVTMPKAETAKAKKIAVKTS